VTPTDSVSTGRFTFSPQYLLTAPRVTATVVKPRRIPLHAVPAPGPSESRDEFTSHRDYRNREVVYANLGTAEEFAQIDARGKLVLLRVDKTPDPMNWHHPVIRRAQLERAYDAGAVGVLYHPEEGLLDDNLFATRSEGANPSKPMPYAILVAREADRLIDLIGEGKVEVSIEGTPSPKTPYIYSIKPYVEGRVPSGLRYEFEQDDLARIDTTVHAAWSDWIRFRTPTRRPHEFVTFPTFLDQLEFPGTVPVYFGPVYRDAVYEVGASSGTGWHETGLYGFDRPGRAEAHLGRPPLVPGVPDLNPSFTADVDQPFTVCSGCRQGDTFYPQMLAVTAQRHLLVSPFVAGSAEGEVHLFRDGVEIAARPWLGSLPVYDLPSEAARYTLKLSEQGSQSTWDFTSRGVTDDDPPDGYACWATFFLGSTEPCRAEPLVFLNYAPELGLDNLARAGRSGEIEVTAYHHEAGGPSIAGLKLWISTNDGATWQPAKVKSRGDGVYEADVKYPKLSQTTGAVSLRAEAWDVAGNRVDQTVPRAFGLRDGPDGGHDDDDDDDDDD
jgi:hypothetical protein